MRRMVRDDIIALDSFVAAEFKYNFYLELIWKSGNYCFLDQFKKLIPSGSTIIKGMIEKRLIATENINKNYKYLYLTDTAMKYLYLKDSEIDYSDLQKNKISVMKVSKYPSEKQLFSSAYKFELLLKGEKMIDKISVLGALEDIIIKQKLGFTKKEYNEWFDRNNIYINRHDEIIKEKEKKNEIARIVCSINQDIFSTENIKNEYRKLIREKSQAENEIKEINESKTIFNKSKIKILNDKIEKIDIELKQVNNQLTIINNTIRRYNNEMSRRNDNINKLEKSICEAEQQFKDRVNEYDEKIAPEMKKCRKIFENLYNISKVIARINNNILEFIIFDCGTLKTALGYFKLINNIKELKLDYINIKIIIYSYSEKRSINLYNEFMEACEKKNKALNTIKAYNSRVNQYDTGQRPDFYINANKIINSTPDFVLEVRDDFYYMEKYKECATAGTKSIKRKDKKAIESLIEKLKE